MGAGTAKQAVADHCCCVLLRPQTSKDSTLRPCKVRRALKLLHRRGSAISEALSPCAAAIPESCCGGTICPAKCTCACWHTHVACAEAVPHPCAAPQMYACAGHPCMCTPGCCVHIRDSMDAPPVKMFGPQSAEQLMPAHARSLNCIAVQCHAQLQPADQSGPLGHKWPLVDSPPRSSQRSRAACRGRRGKTHTGAAAALHVGKFHVVLPARATWRLAGPAGAWPSTSARAVKAN